MALPYQFGTATSPSTGWLDSNFNALGSLVWVPCSVAGTNTLTLTPGANYPSVTYGSGLVVTGMLAGANTTSVVVNVSALGLKNVYKDSSSGPTVLTGSELVANNELILIYDVNLNSGNGGFHYVPTYQSVTTQTVPQSLIAGLIPSGIGGSSIAASLTVSAGQAADATAMTFITASTSIAWAVANGNAINGYQGGGTLPASSTIHFYVANGTSGTGIFADTGYPATLTRFPSGYATYARRAFSLNTNAAGVLYAGTGDEIMGGALLYYLGTQTLDAGTITVGTSIATLTIASAPTGIKVQPLVRISVNGAAGNTFIFTSPDETNVAPSSNGVFTAAPGFDTEILSSGYAVFTGFLTTNTSGQAYARASTTGQTLSLVTRGFVDWRRS